jgi:integrase
MAKRGHTSNGAGTLLLERKIAGINIRRASGTKSPDELAAIILLLEALGKTGRVDLVAKVASGQVRALALLRLSLAGQPFPSPTSAAPLTLGEAIKYERRALLLADAVPLLILSKKHCRPSHLKEMRRQLLALAKRHPEKLVSDLSGVLIKEREAYTKVDHRAAFTRLRANSMVLAAWADGGAHGKTWLEVRDGIATTPVEPKQRRKHNPFKVSTMETLRRLMNQTVPGTGEVLVALCLTGMRPSEYWGRVWYVDRDCIRVNGTKTRNAQRQVPVIAEVAQPVLTFQLWARVFREVLRKYITLDARPGTALAWTPYDCRRSFAHWCDEAGVPRGRSAHYLGHSPTTITDHYAFSYPTDDEVREDGARLRDFLPASLAAEEAAINADGSIIRAHRAAHTPLVLEFGKT